MATAAPDDEVPGPSGSSGNMTAALLVDSRISTKISMCIGHKWRALGREMGFEEGELSTLEINNHPYGLQEIVYKMLDEWKRRMSSRATIEILAEHLKEVRQVILAEEILTMAEESKLNLQSYLQRTDKPWRSVLDGRGLLQPHSQAPPMSQAELDRTWTTMKSALQMEHKRRQIPKIPWLKDWEMDFEKYYVNLTIKHKTCTDSTLHLHNIFNPKKGEVDIPTRILIEGPAGYGKSTLACKLCYDHAKGKNYIQQFDAVILLRVRALKETLEETITDTLQLKDYTAEQVLETIKQNQSKILVILDGFDELHRDKYKHIIPLLEGKQLPHATVIVTSRLGSIELENANEEASSLNLLHCMDRRILIEGVTGESRIGFLQLFFSACSYEKVSSLISLVENRFDIYKGSNRNLFDCPLFLVLLVTVSEEVGIDSIKTKTELYKTLFNFILRRMFAKEGQTNQRLDFFDFNERDPPDYVQQLYQFGLFAGKALKEGKHCFSAEDIFRGCSESLTILKLGILTQHESKSGYKRIIWYEPLHLTFLEFALAYSLWITFVYAPDRLPLFSLRCIMDFFIYNWRSLVVPFLFGLCGKHLTTACSSLRHNKNAALRILSSFYDEHDLIAESQLKVSELAKAFLPLIPSDYVVLDKDSDFNYRILHKETLKQALQLGQINRIIYNGQSNWGSAKLCSNLPRKVKSYFVDADILFEDWCDLPTHQNVFTYISDDSCKFVLTICDADLTEQLSWLSDWLIIKPYLNKPIHEITYSCPQPLLGETLRKTEQLISEEKVVSFTLVAANLRCSSEIFEDFVQCANRSTQLLDMNIIADTDNLVVIELGGKEGKRWRKIELVGHIIPCVGNLKGSLDEFRTLDENSFIRELPSRIHTFHLTSFVSSCMPLRLVVQNNDSPTDQSLREIHVTFSKNAQSLLELCNSGYLNTLEVLAIGLSTEIEINERDISSILSIISHCRSLVRLELWEGWTEEFIVTLFEALIKEKNHARSKHQSDSKYFLLDTLVLSPFVSSKNEIPESTTATLAKELLQSGVLRQLWVSSVRKFDGYAKTEFLKSFFSAEDFICEMEEKYVNRYCIQWAWPWFRDGVRNITAKNLTMTLIKISVEKKNQIIPPGV